MKISLDILGPNLDGQVHAKPVSLGAKSETQINESLQSCRTVIISKLIIDGLAVYLKLNEKKKPNMCL